MRAAKRARAGRLPLASRKGFPADPAIRQGCCGVHAVLRCRGCPAGKREVGSSTLPRPIHLSVVTRDADDGMSIVLRKARIAPRSSGVHTAANARAPFTASRNRPVRGYARACGPSIRTGSSPSARMCSMMRGRAASVLRQETGLP
jgi:hypothetical protein